jgi:hypothetical protein
MIRRQPDAVAKGTLKGKPASINTLDARKGG